MAKEPAEAWRGARAGAKFQTEYGRFWLDGGETPQGP